VASDLKNTRPTVVIDHVAWGDVGHGNDLRRLPVMRFRAAETTFPHGEKLSVGQRDEILKALAKPWPLVRTRDVQQLREQLY
jgi:hypothetical protein